MKKVMVIIPVHNGVGMIERTLDSLMTQTLIDFDIFVIDNQSDDGTDKIVAEYIQKIRLLSSTQIKLKYITNEKNLGRIGNWNKALNVFQNSDSELCKIMFVGDTIAPNCLLNQREAITEQIQVVTCAHAVVKEDGTMYTMQHFEESYALSPEESLAYSLEKGNWFGGTMGCVLFSKTALNKHKFSHGLKWAGDWNFWVDISRGTNVYYRTEALATFYMDSRKGYKRMVGSEKALLEEKYVRGYVQVLLNKLSNES